MANRARAKIYVENVVFNVRWFLPLFYLGLIFVLGVFGYVYTLELYHMITHLPSGIEPMKILVLDMVDIVMIANLVKMIIAGSYHSFISKDHGRKNEFISSGQLKIKIMTSVLVVASISLLRSFVTESCTFEVIQRQLMIYGGFIVCTMALGVLEYLHIKGEQIEHNMEHNSTEGHDHAH